MAIQTSEPTETEEEELIIRAQRDDATAFREIFDRFYPMIHAFCYRSCLDQAQAQDLAQETFIKAARSLGTYRGDASFKSWLYRIAANTTHDWLRQKMRQTQLAEVLREPGMEPDPQGNEEPDRSHVTEALRALPDDLRLAIVLTYYEGMNHAAAAQVLGCAETTVSWRVFRAKRKLKTLLSRRES